MRYLGISKTYYATCVKKFNMDLHGLMNHFKSINSFRKRRDYFYSKYKDTVDEYYLDSIWEKYIDAEIERIQKKEFGQWLLKERKKEIIRFTDKQN